jgi:hypothetical protein
MSSDEKIYFLLLDAFGQAGCAVCVVLRSVVCDWIAADTATARGARRLIVGACSAHARLVADHLRTREPSLRGLLASLRAMRPTASPSQRRWTSRWGPRWASYRCILCGLVEQREPAVLRAFLGGLREIQFVRAFRSAPPLCLTHELRLPAARSEPAREFAGLQQAKLAGLSDQLLHHEALGDMPASVEAVLRYLGGEQEAAPWAGSVEKLAAVAQDSAPATEPADSFEAARLKHEVEDLTRRLGDAESRAAALHYRVAVLTEENRNWELRYTGLAAEARTLEAEVRAARAKQSDGR